MKAALKKARHLIERMRWTRGGVDCVVCGDPSGDHEDCEVDEVLNAICLAEQSAAPATTLTREDLKRIHAMSLTASATSGCVGVCDLTQAREMQAIVREYLDEWFPDGAASEKGGEA